MDPSVVKKDTIATCAGPPHAHLLFVILRVHKSWDTRDSQSSVRPITLRQWLDSRPLFPVCDAVGSLKSEASAENVFITIV